MKTWDRRCTGAHLLGTADACTAPELVPRYPATAAADAMLADAASSMTAVCPEASHPLHTPKESTVPSQHKPDASRTPYTELQALAEDLYICEQSAQLWLGKKNTTTSLPEMRILNSLSRLTAQEIHLTG